MLNIPTEIDKGQECPQQPATFGLRQIWLKIHILDLQLIH